MGPTQADFVVWVRTQMGIPTSALPDGSSVIDLAYQVAVALANPQLNQVSPFIYTQAVYNLAGDNLVNYANDVTGSTYFQTLRDTFKIGAFSAGVVQSASDNGTSTSIAVSQALQTLTLQDLQNMKTPWGRQYLAFAQMVGPLWGLT